jgi:hypothetical protein
LTGFEECAVDDRYGGNTAAEGSDTPKSDGSRCVEMGDIGTFNRQNLGDRTKGGKVGQQSPAPEGWKVVDPVESLHRLGTNGNSDGLPPAISKRLGYRRHEVDQRRSDCSYEHDLGATTASDVLGQVGPGGGRFAAGHRLRLPD